jgi:soluble lytic murein transglycosylase-like protein
MPVLLAPTIAAFAHRRAVRMFVAAVLGASCGAALAASDAPVDAALISALREEASNYEHGVAVAKDGLRAAALYCAAAKLGDAESQFNLGWMYANGRGVARDDSLAAFFFASAAEQGVEQAARMFQAVGGMAADVPECMRDPVVPAEPVTAAAPETPPFQIQTRAPKVIVDLVKKIASGYRVEPQLVLAIMKAESNFDTAAVSPKNAKGLMQLMPDTAARFGVKDVFDPKQNIRGGVAYLRWLLAYFEGDLTLVAAAYNAGEGTVERYKGVPPYLETRSYVSRVVQATGAANHPFDASITLPSPQLRLIHTGKSEN